MIDQALQALRDGKFFLIYDFDDREGETDLAIRSDAVTPKDILTMRKDGGGLICTAIHPAAAHRLGLPFASDVFAKTQLTEEIGDIPYDRKNHSSFSLWVNHKNTFTGITDRDRTLTITEIGHTVNDAMAGRHTSFSAQFRTPGHCPILRAADDLLHQRRGQTELSVALAAMAGVTPAVTICELLDDRTGKALRHDDAKRYAQKHGFAFVGGNDVLEAWDGRAGTLASAPAHGHAEGSAPLARARAVHAEGRND
ncbi:3,4-dihydroxy-2-butanone-4-phosphate synthase [Methanoregula sp. UBA64]|jgi:3,4-dihydroxy 2-butanone 4-phosphate synthase|uniref:3,4-dihydroxy-2-butanone-4-phosphate synthase n=1 Tax=Methanoregula sp. UBA64 TaxID=1915554 RepID=UPI0025DD6D16|nr:3,4-dihydroxy-2-butanone-4-phosphate synthase [Methanoregula sp. UBA64]